MMVWYPVTGLRGLYWKMAVKTCAAVVPVSWLELDAKAEQWQFPSWVTYGAEFFTSEPGVIGRSIPRHQTIPGVKQG